jgi:hypothetical protein
MSIKFYSLNLVDQATITASSENAQFPVSNIKDFRRTKVFRSTSNSDNIVFDFNETSQIDSVLMADNPRDGFGFSTVTLELNGTDAWGSPAFSTPLNFSTQFGLGLNSFNLQSYRFARLVMTSAIGYCESPKLFIGKELGFARSPQFGWSFQDTDLSRVTENRYGQKFVDIIQRRKRINISFNLLTKDDLDLIFEIYDTKGLTKPFWVSIGCDNMINDVERFSGMVYFDSIPTITNNFFNRYSLSMSLEEAT